jgi:deoxyribonuclease IV
MFSIGAHIPREKNLLETMKIIKDADGNSLQIFVSNPRSVNVGEFNRKFLGNPNEIQSFIIENNFKLIIHSPYTINLASSTMINKRHINLEECYWIKIMLKELEIAHILGSIGCVIHTGKSTKLPIKDCLINMKKGIEFILETIINNQWSSKLILETASGQGTELLSNYQDFLNFYNEFDNRYKDVFKICIDTCHIWAKGYELKEIFDITLRNNNINDIVLIHLNNSKNPKGSHLDRHDIINQGFINIIDIYRFVKNFRSLNKDIIIILETPTPNFKYEIHQIKKHS